MRRRCAAPPPSCATPPTARSSRRSRSTPRGSGVTWRLLRSGGALSNHWNIIAATHVFPLDPPSLRSVVHHADGRDVAAMRFVQVRAPGIEGSKPSKPSSSGDDDDDRRGVVRSSRGDRSIDRSLRLTYTWISLPSSPPRGAPSRARLASEAGRRGSHHPEIDRCLGPNQPRERERERATERSHGSIDRSIDRSSRRALRRRDARSVAATRAPSPRRGERTRVASGDLSHHRRRC